MTAQQTASLAEFLLARIAEDEAWIRGDGNYLDECQECAFSDHGKGIYRSTRLLAEVEAKRRIVELHDPATFHGDPCDAHDANFETIPCETLRLLALPYADHEGYRSEWAP